MRTILGCCLFLCGIAMGSLAWAWQSTPPGIGAARVTLQEVWRAVTAALQKRGLAEQSLPRANELDLPGSLPALAGHRLRVSSMCWDAVTQRAQFRLECAEAGQCLPFLVYLRDASDDVRGSVNATKPEEEARIGSCRLTSGPHSVPASLLKPAVRAGDRATAVFLADRLRMTASVTCLERGRAGEVIRVRGLDGHIFRARISGPALLEALPQ